MPYAVGFPHSCADVIMSDVSSGGISSQLIIVISGWSCGISENELLCSRSHHQQTLNLQQQGALALLHASAIDQISHNMLQKAGLRNHARSFVQVISSGFLQPVGSRDVSHRIAVWDYVTSPEDDDAAADEGGFGVYITNIISQSDIIRQAQAASIWR